MPTKLELPKVRLYIVRDRVRTRDIQFLPETDIPMRDNTDSDAIEALEQAFDPLAIYEVILGDGGTVRDVSEDMATLWWSQIAHDCAFEGSIPAFIRRYLSDDELMSCLSKSERDSLFGRGELEKVAAKLCDYPLNDLVTG